MNTVIPPRPTQRPESVPTIQPAPTTGDQPAPLECDTFTPRAGGLFDLGQKALRNIFSIYGPIPRPSIPNNCPSN